MKKIVAKLMLTVLIVSAMVGLMGRQIVMTDSHVQASAPTAAERDRAVQELNRMADIKWKTSSSLYIYNHTYTTSTTYTGMPYTQTYNNTYDEFVRSGAYNGKQLTYKGNAKMGNDCSTVPALAWKFKYSSIQYADIWTGDYLTCAQNGTNSSYHLATVGGYKMGSKDTKQFATGKGLDSMSKYYKELKKGDCCFYRWYDDTSADEKDWKWRGHVVVVVGTYADGVYITDQIGWSSGDSFSTWRHIYKLSYSALYKKYYVPVKFV